MKSPAGRRGSRCSVFGVPGSDLHRRPSLREAIAAVDRTIAARLERELGLLAALAADRREELARGAAPAGAAAAGATRAAGTPAALPLPLRLAAGRAALGLVLVAQRLVKLLLRHRIREV